MKNTRRANFQKLKRSGMRAVDVFRAILEAVEADHDSRPSEKAANLADALIEIGEVYGKRQRANCEAML